MHLHTHTHTRTHARMHTCETLSCAQAIVAGKEPKDLLKDIMAMLRNSASDPTMESFARIMRKWAMDHGKIAI